MFLQNLRDMKRPQTEISMPGFRTARVDAETWELEFMQGYAGVMIGILCVHSSGFLRGSQGRKLSSLSSSIGHSITGPHLQGQAPFPISFQELGFLGLDSEDPRVVIDSAAVARIGDGQIQTYQNHHFVGNLGTANSSYDDNGGESMGRMKSKSGGGGKKDEM
nr:hypothetical protein Iba_chr10aCG16080 [Ipomoea batatas]GMD45970.1 hypothetical protein Iba_chr10dCG15110 [Ipomoea batatas]